MSFKGLHELAGARLLSQQLLSPRYKKTEDLLKWIVAIQGQDYSGAKWSLGLRVPGSTETQVEHAIESGKILRSWVLRGTLHLVNAEDISWLLQLVSPFIIKANARRYTELELDEKTLSRSSALLVKALQKEQLLTRRALLGMLQDHGISTAGQRGVYMLQRASLEGLICQGLAKANNPTFLLLEGFPGRSLSRDEAAIELAERYFNSRGPATLADFTWWSGLPAAVARFGLEAVKPHLSSEVFEGKEYWFSPSLSSLTGQDEIFLLPGFDEFLLAYKDRTASLGMPNFNYQQATGGLLPGTIVLNGKVVGTWRRIFKKDFAEISFKFSAPLPQTKTDALSQAAEMWGKFVGVPVKII